MPKIKTHSGAKKRFSVTKNGKFKRGHVGKRHLLNGHGIHIVATCARKASLTLPT